MIEEGSTAMSDAFEAITAIHKYEGVQHLMGKCGNIVLPLGGFLLLWIDYNGDEFLDGFKISF